MNTIPADLQADYTSGNYSLALLVKITRTDAVVEYTTTSDQDETFDAHLWVAAKGVAISDLETSGSLAVNNADISRFLDVDTKEAIRAGVFDFAQIEVWEFNRNAPAHGKFWRGTGSFGELSVQDRLTFKGEFRSLSQALSRTLGFNCTALCPYTLGDANCRKDLGGLSEDGYALTATGTLTGVSADRSVMFDTDRTEPGPALDQIIFSITNAKPGRVTLLTALTLPNGSAIIMSDIDEPALLNTVTVIRNKAADGLSFDLGIDTTDTAVYPAFVYGAGGRIAPMVTDAGYFGYGRFTAKGITVGIKAYRPGQIVLQAPFPVALEIGDTYVAIVGCDHLIKTCRDKFDNVAPTDGGGGFGGSPYVGGQDKSVQVGRQT